MIQAIYYRQYNRLTIEGHAHSDEPGKDLVCAGASTLAYTLAANVANLSDNGFVRDVTVKLEPGDTEIACKSKSGSQVMVGRIFESVCVGFEILATNYPQYISYEIRG